MSESSFEKLYLPQKIFIIYILFTVALNTLGPWEYRDYKSWITICFIGSFLFLFTVGYESGCRNRIHILEKRTTEAHLMRWLKVCILLTLALNLALFIERSMQSEMLSLSSMVGRIGQTYFEALKRAKEIGPVSSIGQLITLAGIFKLYALVVGFLWFGRLPGIWRIFFILMITVIILNVIYFLGTQKVIGDILIYYFSAKLIKTKTLKVREMAFWGIFATVIVLLLFSLVQLARLGDQGVFIDNLKTDPRLVLNNHHLVFSILGPQLGLATASLFLYFSMGYYGLTLSIQQPFVWTYGLGGSFALSSYAEQYFKLPNMLSQTYPLRTEMATGWPALSYWHTIFPWLASDMTFLGSLIFLAFLAGVYAKAWKEVLFSQNILSAILFAHLNILWLYVPANNQLMQTRESTITTIMLIVLWLIFHRRFNYPHPARRPSYGTI